MSPNDTALWDRTASCGAPLWAAVHLSLAGYRDLAAAIIEMAANSSDIDSFNTASGIVAQKRKRTKSFITVPPAVLLAARARETKRAPPPPACRLVGRQSGDNPRRWNQHQRCKWRIEGNGLRGRGVCRVGVPTACTCFNDFCFHLPGDCDFR